eukprot:CAMPEP_0116891806 /NCGR_PEP_ID=MMETSP0467-20121206/2144_1 /TAXON_ID=283647 /ORGANISM="Mesodinium pulex, Strain SPMC105" /LENGTH=164 /DNA_ID=CAMNT_0004560533 /DNA_START=1406 /DNA_END=1900 /DNA_ORIENTATION=+
MSKVGSKNGSKVHSVHSSRIHSRQGSSVHSRNLSNFSKNKSPLELETIGKTTSQLSNLVGVNLNQSFVSKHSSSGSRRRDVKAPVISVSKDKNKTLSRQHSKAAVIKQPDGSVVDIVKLSDDEMANKYPLVNINPIPPRRFEIRFIIWNGEDVPAVDLDGSSDA